MTLPAQNTEVVIPRAHKMFHLVVHNGGCRSGEEEDGVCVYFESLGEEIAP